MSVRRRQAEIRNHTALDAGIPRRTKIAVAKRRADFAADARSTQSTQPGFGALSRRLFVWLGSLIWLAAGNLGDRMRFRSTRATRARRLRQMLQTIGGAGIKIGQQLSLRADIIPIEYCDELVKLLDQVPPFPAPQAMAIIERETKRPLAEIFLSFDPNEIGAGSIGCVYQAHLHDGTKVAVKVRRPGIELQVRCDLKIMELLGTWGEALGLTPGGRSRHMIREISRMLLDEIDYRLEALQTEAFGREASLRNIVNVPAIISRLCGPEVLVTQFMEGVFLYEILNAQEDEDQASFETLRAQGYDTTAISRNLVRLMFWQIYESSMFHADPHPANIVVRPDNSVGLIDFGACGALSKKSRRALQAMHRHYDDPHEMARAIVATQQPLPYIDVDQYTHELYYLVRDQTLAMKSDSAKWYEKSSGALWARAAEIGREYKITLNPELLRFMRTSFLGEAILVRLNPNLNAAEEFLACYDDYLTTKQNRNTEFFKKNRRLILGETVNRIGSLVDLIQLDLERKREELDRPHYRYGLRVDKSSFVISAIIKTLVWWALYLFLWANARAIFTAMRGSPAVPFIDHVTWTLTNPIFLGLLAINLLVVFRKLTLRLDEPDLTRR